MSVRAHRDMSRNAGLVALADLDETKYIVGVVVVLMDDDGNFSSEWRPVSMDAVPDPAVQEVIGPFVEDAFVFANNPGLAESTDLPEGE
jgi:hypothetical protein